MSIEFIPNRESEASLTAGAIYKVLPNERDQASLRVLDASEAVTIHLDPVLKGILRAERLAAPISVSALLRDWIDERLDLPVEV